MVTEILLLLGSLVLILMGANFLVDGSSSIARKFGLSEFLIGLTIVGVGTSTPEMVVSYMSAFQGTSDLAIGNVIGSNIFNVLIILGVTALIVPLDINKSTLKRDIPINIFVSILLIVLGLSFAGGKLGMGSLSRVEGGILLALYAWYLWHSFKNDSAESSGETEEVVKQYGILVSVLFIIGGLLLLIFGGKMFVNSATELAKLMGVSDKFIAITIVSAGTSKPELATSVVAAHNGRGPLALGNVLRSNISNILLILGGAALIHPLSFAGMTMVDLSVLLLSMLMIFASAYMFKKNKLDRIEGVIFIAVELAYMWYLIVNL